MSEAAAANDPDVIVPTTFQYLKPRQVSALQQEQQSLERQLNGPTLMGADRGDMEKRRRAIVSTLREQQAPDLTPEQRDKWLKEQQRLEGVFVPEMQSAEVMRKNPPGSVDIHRAFNKRFNRLISRWKNITRALHKGDEGPNIANIERFRRHSHTSDPSMGGAQIEGRTYIGLDGSEQYKLGHDRTFGPEPQTPAAGDDYEKSSALCGKEMDNATAVSNHQRACPTCKAIGEKLSV